MPAAWATFGIQAEEFIEQLCWTDEAEGLYLKGNSGLELGL